MSSFAAAMERRHRTQIFEKILLESPERLPHSPKPATVASSAAPVSPLLPVGRLSLQESRSQAVRAMRHGDFEAAVALIASTLAAGGVSDLPAASIFELRILQAEALRRAERSAEALEVLDEAETLLQGGVQVAWLPQQVDLLQARAAVSVSLGDLTRAEAELVEAVNRCERDERNASRLCRLYRDLANVYLASGHESDAIGIIVDGLALLERESVVNPGEKMALLQLLAGITHQQGACTAAASHLLDAYRVAQEADRQDEMAHLEAILGTLYAQHGDDEAARQWLTAAVARLEACGGEPGCRLALLYTSLAQVETRLGLEEAAETFNRAVALQLRFHNSTCPLN
jgi:tetratricopeptide (TPR) repeat protein